MSTQAPGAALLNIRHADPMGPRNSSPAEPRRRVPPFGLRRARVVGDQLEPFWRGPLPGVRDELSHFPFLLGFRKLNEINDADHHLDCFLLETLLRNWLDEPEQ